MGVIICSGLYFMLSHVPTYIAWDRHSAAGVRKDYPAWSLIIAAMLALSSLVPILLGLLAQAVRTSSAGDRGKFYRVDTTASTRPMLGEPGEFNQDFPELPIGAEDSDSDDGGGVVVMASDQNKTKQFRLEVVE